MCNDRQINALWGLYEVEANTLPATSVNVAGRWVGPLKTVGPRIKAKTQQKDASGVLCRRQILCIHRVLEKCLLENLNRLC